MVTTGKWEPIKTVPLNKSVMLTDGETIVMSKWEVFFDKIYFDMFAVRSIGDKNFHSPRLFYFDSKEDAMKCKEILDKCYCGCRLFTLRE